MALLPSGTAPRYSMRCLTDLFLLPLLGLIDDCDDDGGGEDGDGTDMGSYSVSDWDMTADEALGGSDLGGVGKGMDGGERDEGLNPDLGPESNLS